MLDTEAPTQTLEAWLRTQPRHAPPSLDGLSVGRLNLCLSGGLSRPAAMQLRRMAAAGDRRAAAVLGRFLVRKGEYKQAAPLLLEAEPTRSSLHHLLLLTHSLIRTGQMVRAGRRLDELMARFGPVSDVLLSQANFVLPDGRAYVDALNQIYRRSGLVELEAPREAGAYRFDLLGAKPPPPVNDAVHRISVLVPAFNAERLLGAALDSLLAQSWRNIEIIVVDDQSTDGTAAIAEAYAARDSRVIALRHDKNRGAYPARNTALQHATGRWVTVHDADDWSHPQKLEIQARHQLRTGAPIVASAAVRVLENMSINFRAPQGTHLLTSFPSFMIERRLALDVGGWDCVRMGADAEMYSRIASVLGVRLSDPMPDTPLSFMLSSPESLSGQSLTGLDSVRYGARRQYIDAYSHWHAGLAGAPPERLRIDPDKRPFPAPGVFFRRGNHVQADEAFVFDFAAADVAPVAAAIEAALEGGRKVALVHWPQPKPRFTTAFHEAVQRLIAARDLPVVVPGERLTARIVTFTDQSLLQCVPDSLPEVTASAYGYLDAA